MRFGVRECVDLVFKAAAENQRVGSRLFKKYQPVFKIDTARTSTLEQATAVVYAQGGRGYNRLIAWEGEKTITFTVEDALMSPMGLAVLSGAGLIDYNGQTNADGKGYNTAHVHCTVDLFVDANGFAELTVGDLREETYLYSRTSFDVCYDTATNIYGTVLDGSGSAIDWIDGVKVCTDKDANKVYSYENNAKDGFIHMDEPDNDVIYFYAPSAAGKLVQFDFYIGMSTDVQEIEIKPEDFGGFFYVEGQTLFRREDTGKDMAAEIIFPRVKVQSAFTFTMSASGDPSTFTFTMDAFPAYTQFDPRKKVNVKIQVLGGNEEIDDQVKHTHQLPHVSPSGAYSNEDITREPLPEWSASIAGPNRGGRPGQTVLSSASSDD